jgi:hypothetical protein
MKMEAKRGMNTHSASPATKPVEKKKGNADTADIGA